MIVEPFDAPVPIEAAVVSFSDEPTPAILESSVQKGSYGRFSIFACDPVESFSHSSRPASCPFRALERCISLWPALDNANSHLPFVGGWIGYIAYEAGLTIEHIDCTTTRDLPLPLIRFNLYDAAAIYDHAQQQWYLTAIEWPRAIAARSSPVSQRLARLYACLDRAQSSLLAEVLSPPVTTVPNPNMSHAAYVAKVERAKRYIEAGDIYQVNLTQRFTTRTDLSPLALYHRLRRANPSSHGAFLPWDEAAVLSSSPELFLELRNGHVVTRPIKGTRPRGTDPHSDAAHRRELVNSEKDRAELTMIIDLLRNDLGRVCSYGSVRVANADEIEEHPTVFHRVATIEGDLRPRCNRTDLLRAAFPGGSVTGAPKIRAMQIINELEPTARDVYCGSIGMIGLDGSMSLNIAIRTMVQIADVVHLYAGGAIVADSTPEEEYNEILAKAEGMLRALGCEEPARMSNPREVTVP